MTTKAKRSKPPRAAAVATPTAGDQETTYVPTGNGGEFILLSDLHVHPWAAFASGDGATNTRLRRSLDILDHSLAEAKRRGVPWVFAGDLVHTAGYALNVVMAEITDCLMRYPDVLKLAVWGNHDARGIGGRITLSQTVLATLARTVPKFIVLDPSVTRIAITDPATGLSFSGAGYQPHGEVTELGHVADVGIYHQTVVGSKTPQDVPLLDGVEGAALLARHRFVAVGHVHHWQYVPCADKSKTLLIPGSPEHHNFGDSGKHGWWVVEIPTNKTAPPELQFVPGGSPEFLTVDTPAQTKRDGNFYRVRTVPIGSTLPDGTVAVAPSPTTVQSRDVLRGARGEAAVALWVQSSKPDAALGDPAELTAIGTKLLADSGLVATMRPMVMAEYELTNFCSYGSSKVALTPGVKLVLGRGRDYPSNGAGKSTLFEAVFWALFGRTTKGLSADEVIRRGTDGCRVRVRLVEPGGTAWCELTRSRGSYGNTLTVMTDAGPLEAESSTALTQRLTEWLGITPELYQALGYFSQEKLLLFAAATDGERKTMLADLLGLAGYQAAQTRAGKLMTEAEQETQTALRIGEESRAREQRLRERLAQAEAQSGAWVADHAIRLANAETALASWLAGEAATREHLIASHSDKASAATASLAATAEQTLQKHRAELAALPPFPATIDADVAAARTAAQNALAAASNLATQIKSAELQVTNLTRRLDTQLATLGRGICPSCQQQVTEDHRELCVAPVRADIAEAEQQVQALRAQQPAVMADAVATKQALGVLEPLLGIKQMAAALQTSITSCEQNLAAYATTRENIAKQAAATADAYITGERLRHDQAVAVIKREQDPHRGTVDSLLTSFEESEAEQRESASAAEYHNAMAARYAYWQHGFSKQGLQSLIVDEVATAFNAMRGTVFPALTQGVYDVQFSTVSQTKAGEWRERTEFQVFEHGQPVPYAALSGGQRRRVDIGVMLTLVLAVSRWMGTPGMLGWLVLDEVFGFLDTSGSEGLSEALREVQNVIPTICVVSHDAQLQALFPDAWVVVQDNDGMSTVSEVHS